MAANTTRRRAGRPARWPTGTPTRPGAGAPDGTRTEAGSEAAGRPDGWAGTSRTGPRLDTAQSRFWRKKQSSQLTFVCRRASVCHARSSSEKLDLVGDASKPTSPPSCNDDSRKSQEVHTWLNTCKQRDISATRRKRGAISVAFESGWRPSLPPGLAAHATAMNILVTGITGFVGASLAPRLERDGHAVRGLSRHPPLTPPAHPGRRRGRGHRRGTRRRPDAASTSPTS